MGFLQRKITVAEASKTTRQKGLCALVRVYTCFYNNSVGRSIYIYNIGGVPEKSGRVIKGGVSFDQELELLLFRRRWASVELSTGSRVAVGGRERASNVAFMAPWRETGEERG